MTSSLIALAVMHRLLGDSLDNDAVAGAYRENRAFITGSSYPVSAPKKIEAEMSALVEQIANNEQDLHPVELAAQLHKSLVFIHPFADGNGRVARLAMNTVLLQNSYMGSCRQTRPQGYCSSGHYVPGAAGRGKKLGQPWIHVGAARTGISRIPCW